VTEDQPTRVTAEVDAIDIYWRPGCPFCDRLLAVLEHAGTPIRLHNIWSDDEARAFVRSQNKGNETVPTVRIGDMVTTNPDPARLVSFIEERFPALASKASTRPS
jgi:mycoredoxin